MLRICHLYGLVTYKSGAIYSACTSTDFSVLFLLLKSTLISGILKLEDYKFKEDTTHQAYFPSATVFNKVRNLLGFNLETEAIPLPNGKLFDVTKECDQVVVSALVRTTIKYDDGGHFSHYKKF